MTNSTDNTDPILTEETTKKYLDYIFMELAVENRVKHITTKIDQAYKTTFKIPDQAGLNYACFFQLDNTLIFKVSTQSGYVAHLPKIPTACLWSDTELYIGIQLMITDLEEEYKKEIEKAKKLLEENPPEESLWQKIKKYFGF